MIKLYDGQITDLLPEKIAKDTETRCLSFAIQQEHQRLLRLVDMTRTLSVIDELPEAILDVCAVELRTPYYQQDMDIETKRNIIKRTLMWHTKAGTPNAVRELIEIVFGQGEVVEWFDYDEPPYTPGTFDIVTNARMTEEIVNYFLAIIERVKNTRSHIRRILIERGMNMHETVAAGTKSSPKITVLNHHDTAGGLQMHETVAAGVKASPSGTVTNAPQQESDAGMDVRAAAGAKSTPHETIGNNVDPRAAQASGGIHAFAGAAARGTKTTIYNGAYMASVSIGLKQYTAVAGAAHSKTTI